MKGIAEKEKSKVKIQEKELQLFFKGSFCTF